MKDSNTFHELLKVIVILREQYRNSRIGSTLQEEQRTWDHIKEECDKRGIDSDIILVDEDTFRLMQQKEQVIVDYLKN